jgi:hemolysin activation/secretion protein
MRTEHKKRFLCSTPSLLLLLLGLGQTPGIRGETLTAQGATGLERLQRPGSTRRQPLPEYRTPQPSAPLEAPAPEQAPESERLSGLPRFFVKKFRISGNTAFSDRELAAIVAPYENRQVNSEELQELRHKLTLHYVNNGYINSGAVIPDQEVKDNIVEIRIIEGTLTRIDVAKTGWLRESYVQKRIALEQGAPLEIRKLQDRLLLLQQDPLIDRIHAELGPGSVPGESTLKVRVEEARPYELGIGFNNYRSPSIGSNQGHIFGIHRNLTGWGDTLGVRYWITEGFDDVSTFYSVPLSAYDARLQLSYNRSHADTIEKPFNILDITSEAESFGVNLSQPFHFGPYRTLTTSLALDRRHSETLLFGRGFPFALGIPSDGQSDVTVLRFGLEWLERTLEHVIAARSIFNFGLDMWGATINERNADGHFANCPDSTICPDGRFFSWLGQLQWARRLPWWDSEVIFRADLQLADSPLLPLEMFSVGGAYSVRGYRENQLVQDNGWASSLEFRLPLARLPLPWLSEKPDDGTLKIAPFLDIGRSWDSRGDLSPAKTLLSVGVGLRWDPSRKVHADLYWGHALKPIENPDHGDLQDEGIHFQFSASIF